jgi:hypothetical protein
MKTIGHYNSEELAKDGYVPIGMPALMVGTPKTINSEQMCDAIQKTNGNISYDAIAKYWKSSSTPGLYPYNQIIGDIKDADFMIVQALKRNNP